MDYEKLKEVIAKQIKENGQREITGPVLQAVLMAMVDSLGEVYPQTYTDEEKAQARANIDALSNYDGEIAKEKLSLEVQAILNDVANKQNISDATLATIAKTIVGAINEVYKGGLEDASIATSKIKDGAITEPKLDTDLINVITSAVQPAELASAIATALASYVAKADIVATTGSATDKVMSQHGVTEAIDGVTNKVTELESEVIGQKEVTFQIVSGQNHSSTKDRIEVSIKKGDFFSVYLGGEFQARSYLNLAYSDSTSEMLGLKIGKVTLYKASKDIESLGVYLEGVSGNTDAIFALNSNISFYTLAKGVFFVPKSKTIPNIDTLDGKITMQGDMVVGDAFYSINATINIKNGVDTAGLLKVVYDVQTGILKTIPYDTAMSNTDILLGCVRVNDGITYSEFISADFPFEYSLNGLTQNRLLSNEITRKRQHLHITQDHSSTRDRLDFSIRTGDIIDIYVKGNSSWTVQVFFYDKDGNGTRVLGFNSQDSYKGRVKATKDFESIGVFVQTSGNNGDLMLDVRNMSVFDEVRETMVVPFLSSTNNIILDESNKSVTILSNGFFLKYEDRGIAYEKGNDIVLSYSANSAPNGAYMLNPSVFELDSTSVSLDVLSNYISYERKDSDNYKNYIPLFATYYGNIIMTGIFSEVLLAQKIATKAPIDSGVILENAFISPYMATSVEDKSTEFCSLFREECEAECYLFFTDPHLFGHNYDEMHMKEAMALLKKYYSSNPLSFIMCGGDWLQDTDTQDEACRKLGYIDGMMRGLFNKYLPILGNHDNNYQGKLDSSSENSTGALSKAMMRNLWFREYGKTYYRHDSNLVSYFVLDDGIDWQIDMNDYRWEQVDWLASSLLESKKEHKVIGKHMYYYHETNLAPLSRHVVDLCAAHNARTTITLNGKTYNFADAVGKVDYITVGHSHADFNVIDNGIPIIGTINATTQNILSFDMIFADYTNRIVHCVRVGVGESRNIPMS